LDNRQENYEQHHHFDARSGPLVSILLPTFNRPRRLRRALASVLGQSYGNIQVVVVNDGGEDVTDVVASFKDRRIVFINRKENCGKAFSLNQALSEARGKYIAYIDDDDLYYSNHIQTLVSALENNPQFGAAYSDLYNAHYRTGVDGEPVILSKVVEVSRDFDRFLILCFNHVLHVSLMHRRDLLEKTGPYNEQLKVLIDWDITRRLSFFTDFLHISKITGEYYTTAAEQSDRISVRRRLNRSEYIRDALRIRTTRPPKPWPKIKDLSIIIIARQTDEKLARTLGLIHGYTFYPYKLYLPIDGSQKGAIQARMPNVVTVDVEPNASENDRLDAALESCEGELVAVVPSGFEVGQFWVEDSVYALLNSEEENLAYELERSTPQCRGFVLHKHHLLAARRSFPGLELPESLQAAKITIKKVLADQIPFKFDQLLEMAQRAEKCGDYAKAAMLFEYIKDNYGNEIWMKRLAADALFKAGNLTRAAELIEQVNRERPSVESLLIEAKIKKQQKDFNSAIELLEKARRILDGTELIWT